MKDKLCVVYNFAQLYREPVFRLIDGEWDCDWYFGRNITDIKGMPDDALRSVTYVDNHTVRGNWYWQRGLGRLMRDKRYTYYLMLGEPFCLSTWWALIQRRLFFRRKRVVLWTHGWYGRESRAKKWMKRLFFGMADHVLTYGEYARRVAIGQGFPAGKVTAIHNSLNHSLQTELRSHLTPSEVYREKFCNDDRTLIFIGRLTKVKRLDLLLRAMAELEQRGEHYNLILIGTGEEHATLEKLVGELGLKDKVWFYGACYDDHRNAQLIYDADLCVAPGNVGLTAMHTMVFGTPVLTHDDFPWQMPEFEAIIHGKTGAFFKRDHVASLADAIHRWFEGPGKNREAVRIACYAEIDTNWTPQFQLQIIKKFIH